jgi:hypothetical protein
MSLSAVGARARTTSEGDIGPRERVPARTEDRAQKLEGLDALVAGKAVGHLAPEHLFEDVELPLHLAYVESGREAVSGELVRRGDDRLGVAIAHALDHELKQVLQVTAARLRACRLIARVALLELGNRLVDNPVPRFGKDS